jgi:hypothetical protein
MCSSIGSAMAAHESSAAQKTTTAKTPEPGTPASQPQDTVSLSSAARAALAASGDHNGEAA